MTLNDYRVDNHIHDVALMVENLSKVYVSSNAMEVSLRNVVFSVESVVSPLDDNIIGEK